MLKIKQVFENIYSNWEIELPEDCLLERKDGFIHKNSWLIQYCFGKENDMEYMDIYAEHRMAGPDHTRIYENGETKELFHYKIAYLVDKDPEITKKNKMEFEEYNRNIAQQFIDKGFDKFTINGALLAGFAGKDK